MSVSFKDMKDSGETARAEIQRGLGRIEGQLNSLAQTLSDHTKDDHYNFEAMTKNFNEIQRTMAKVQSNQSKVLGVISFLVIIIPMAIAYFK